MTTLKLLASAVALALHPAAHHHRHHAFGCRRTYTVRRALHAIDAAYDAGLPASASQRARIRHDIRCQRNHAARRYLRHVWHHAKHTVAPVQGPSVASWYYDAGVTGCGFHTRYGIATLIAPCGTRIQICHAGSCIVATRDDSGPYVGGRTFDLNPISKAALGCGDLCSVTWRRLH